MRKGTYLGRAITLFMVLGVFLGLGASFFPASAAAAKFSNRSLALGDTTPGAVTTYSFSWHYNTIATLGSIRFEACTDAFAFDACTPPAGIDFSAAALASQTGVTGFSILSQNSNEIILTRPPAARAAVNASYIFDDVTNPTGPPESFFIRIRTYASADATGPEIENNSVANATTTPIVINAVVPPLLFFCVGITTSGFCSNVSGNFINYGDLRSDLTRYGTSQFQVATNAAGGYVVTANGNTMTSGNKTIDSLSLPTANQVGASQFGINLRANTAPPAGSDMTGLGIGTVTASYSQPDMFLYQNGDIIASAVTGSNFDTFTVTYIVNIPPDQPAGVYNTTITYICTAAF